MQGHESPQTICTASSLPHGFRFHAETPPRRQSSFYNELHEGGPLVPAVDQARAKTRLEVLHAWEVNFAIVSLYTVSLLSFLYELYALNRVRREWFISHSAPPPSIIERAISPLLRNASALLPILFTLRVAAHGSFTPEQIWTGALLFVGLLATNPFTIAAKHMGRGFSSPTTELIDAAQESISEHYVSLILNDAVYTAVTYLYLLMSAHSYRILDNNRIHSLSFYGGKVAIVLIYFFVKVIAGFHAHVVLGLVPFARIFAWLILALSGRTSLRVTVPVFITTALDCAFGLWLLRQVAITALYLARTPYLENRAKQLGFRCFAYQTLIFCVSIVTLAAIAILRLPHGMLYQAFDNRSSSFLQLETPAGHLGLALVYFTWTLVLAYVNLPPGPFLPYMREAVLSLWHFILKTPPARWLSENIFPLLRLPSSSILELENNSVPADIENPILDAEENISSGGTETSRPLGESNIPLRYRHREWKSGAFDQPSQSAFSPFEPALEEPEPANVAARREEDAGPPYLVLGRSVVPSFHPEPSFHPPRSEADYAAEYSQDVEMSRSADTFTDSDEDDPEGQISAPIPIRPVAHGKSHFARLWSPVGKSDLESRRFPPRNEATWASRMPTYGTGTPHHLASFEKRSAPVTRRLRLRKNLFVMETQVILAQAAYLSYVPRNKREERLRINDDLKSKQIELSSGVGFPSSMPHTGSLATNLDVLASEIEEEKRYAAEVRRNMQTGLFVDDSDDSNSRPLRKISSVPLVPDLDEDTDPNRQPNHDDGTMFLVDPAEMAETYGYTIFLHVCNEAMNTHAIVLLGQDRVIVAFSGTRDARNWVTNSQIKRCVFDELFPSFEFERAEDGPSSNPYPTTFSGSDLREVKSANDANVPASKAPLNASKKYNTAMKSKFRPRDRFSYNESNAAMLSILRKTRSSDSLRCSQHSWESASDTQHEEQKSPFKPPLKPTQNYGAIPPQPSRPMLGEMYPSSSLKRTASQRVKVVATTLARELMTLGQAKVHDGFARAYKSLRKKVMGALVELYGGVNGASPGTSGEMGSSTPRAKGLPLFFCGHSLGGALATFGAFEAAKYYKRIGLQYRQNISCTTFGCPMVGNDVFKTRYENLVETHWRLEMASDPVPKLPSSILNYTHVGVRVLLDQSGMLLIDPSFIEVHWWGKLSNPYLGYKLHIRASYLMALRTYCALYKNGEDDLKDSFWPFPVKVQTKGLFPGL